MGAPTASIASPIPNNGLTPVSNNGGKGGKSGMSSLQPSNQTLTADTAQPAMGAPAAYSNTLTPNVPDSTNGNPSFNQSFGQMGGQVLSNIGQNSMNSGKAGNSGVGSVMNQTGQAFQSHGKGQ